MTSIDGSNVKIEWSVPFTGGSPITAYVIKIRLHDEISFTTDMANCNGASADVIASKSCLVPVATLKAAPFLIPWAESVWATV